MKKRFKFLILVAALEVFFITLVMLSSETNITGGVYYKVKDNPAYETDCSKSVEISLYDIEGANQVCARENGVYFLMENKGRDLAGLRLIVDADKKLTFNIHEDILSGEISRQSITFGPVFQGKIKYLGIIPVIDRNGRVVSCADRALDIPSLPECE